MITKFKIFENIHNKSIYYKDLKDLVIGDYVIMKPENLYSNDFIYFIENNVGQIVNIMPPALFSVKYENIPTEITSFFKYADETKFNEKYFDIDEIVFMSKNKSDCELFLATKKYNL